MREVSKEVHFRDRLVSTFVKRDTNFWHAFEKNVKKNQFVLFSFSHQQHLIIDQN